MGNNVISELAEILDTKVRTINHHDSNVFAREKNSSGVKPSDLSFTEALRFQCEGVNAQIKSNGLYLLLEVKADLDAGAWSVNEPDLIMNMSKSQVDSQFLRRMPIYSSKEKLSGEADKIARSDVFLRVLTALELKQSESLNFYANALVYYSRLTTADVFLDRARILCHFVVGIVSTKAISSRVVLPEPFSDLNDCAQQWAISDDAEREEAIEGASREILTSLVARVGLRLPSINAYLDTHVDQESADLCSLAETVTEAQIALKNL